MLTCDGSRTGVITTMATSEVHATPQEERVPWDQLFAYGMGGVIPIALFNAAPQLMGLLGNISLGIGALSIGTVMIIPRLWDALIDPIVGHYSDNLRTPWGRRRPFILIGGIGTAISFVAMWWIPRGDSVKALFPSEAAYSAFQLAFILICLLAFFTSVTVFEIPHGALGMEMSPDYHQRTRLFSAKSLLGNSFALLTPWLIALAGLDYFRGTRGDLTYGMRYVSMFLGSVLIPLTLWWFFTLREPGFAVAKKQQKSSFWQSMSETVGNRTFLKLVAIIFTLAMGFNFVSTFGNYITIFYVFHGDAIAAGPILGFTGTAWAVTGLVAVIPLNWLSRRLGKNTTLLIAILLMCAAQLSKIFCYNPAYPYLLLIPTILLSAGMLMFFTLGASMLGDVCDEDELNTGTRSEGSYCAVYWWIIKMGTAFASFVTGALLVFTSFDERQNVTVDALNGIVATIRSEAEANASYAIPIAKLEEFDREAEKLAEHFAQRGQRYTTLAEHADQMLERVTAVRAAAMALQMTENQTRAQSDNRQEFDSILRQVADLKQQSPVTLFRLRLVEIGLPLLLSAISIALTLRYPLSEARCYEIKAALKARHAAIGIAQTEPV
jgi:glycoside/pentoside/hexuronide:cation symporter, GPH family